MSNRESKTQGTRRVNKGQIAFGIATLIGIAGLVTATAPAFFLMTLISVVGLIATTVAQPKHGGSSGSSGSSKNLL